MLWAWERTEDLRWIPSDVGVAYVATAISLDGARARLTPRANPLYLRADTVAVPVVHVDVSWRQPPVLNAAQKAVVVEQVLAAAATSKHHVVQLDFEVRLSQRAFLQEVVHDIRQRLPSNTALSITALASWCAGDYWLGHMPADEIVPMVFRMGRDAQVIRQQLRAQGRFLPANCSTALGQSSDEAVVGITAKRHYYFSPKAWTADSWRQVRGAQFNS